MHERLRGVMWGTAIGDAIGLPFEGLSPQRVAKRLGEAPLEHSMVFGRGLVSDDTEHTCLVARALAESEGSRERFKGSMARQLGRWVASLPPGIGWATLRSSLKLLLRWPSRFRGVHSAGNGPAMRSALIGVWARHDAQLEGWVRASTRLTHLDPRAEEGAVLVARLARHARDQELPLTSLLVRVRDEEFRGRLYEAVLAAENLDLEAYRAKAGYTHGVSGFVVHTVPAALYCWLRHRGDPRAVIEAAIRLGGDTDTVAAIAGALVGAEVGMDGWPASWKNGLVDWPQGTGHIDALAEALVERKKPPRQPWLTATLRNLVVIPIIVAHVGWRLLGR